MTIDDFKQEALLFNTGDIIVISCSDTNTCLNLCQDTADYILAQNNKNSLIFNSRATTFFSERWFETNVYEAKIWESQKISSGNINMVVNQFDPNDTSQNSEPTNLKVDVFRDIFHWKGVVDIPWSNSTLYPITRSLFPFINQLYYYDINNSSIELIKTQNPQR